MHLATRSSEAISDNILQPLSRAGIAALKARGNGKEQGFDPCLALAFEAVPKEARKDGSGTKGFIS